MAPLLEDGMGTFPGEVERILRNSEGDLSLHQGFMDPGMYLAIDQIHACPFTGSLRAVYLEAKSLELPVFRIHTVLDAIAIRWSSSVASSMAGVPGGQAA
jgi:hypothetical protein